MSFSEQKDLERLIHSCSHLCMHEQSIRDEEGMREVLGQPAISVGDPQRLLNEVANALENLNQRVTRLEDESEAGRRAMMGLR